MINSVKLFQRLKQEQFYWQKELGADRSEFKQGALHMCKRIEVIAREEETRGRVDYREMGARRAYQVIVDVYKLLESRQIKKAKSVLKTMIDYLRHKEAPIKKIIKQLEDK